MHGVDGAEIPAELTTICTGKEATDTILNGSSVAWQSRDSGAPYHNQPSHQYRLCTYSQLFHMLHNAYPLDHDTLFHCYFSLFLSRHSFFCSHRTRRLSKEYSIMTSCNRDTPNTPIILFTLFLWNAVLFRRFREYFCLFYLMKNQLGTAVYVSVHAYMAVFFVLVHASGLKSTRIWDLHHFIANFLLLTVVNV